MTTDYLVGPPTGSTTGRGERRLLPDALSDLSLRQLLSFRAVADQGSFHGAADALDYTQSAISQHVMALESALGVRLFDRSRGRRTVELTEAGRLLLGHVATVPVAGGGSAPPSPAGSASVTPRRSRTACRPPALTCWPTPRERRARSASACTRASGPGSCPPSSGASPRRGRASRSSSARPP